MGLVSGATYSTAWKMPVGAQLGSDGVRFRVWAPDRSRVEAVILSEDGTEKSAHPLKAEGGYFEGYVGGIRAGDLYKYRLDGATMHPDPASRSQPQGVHGPSAVVDPAFTDEPGWQGIELEDAVIYEAHVGTATPEGTFEALANKLPYLKSLGITVLELMPVADFPGERNWGYDGVDLFAPARTYGGAEALKTLVRSAHKEGIAVVLDVVYNHFGPDGNYLREFSKAYFTSAEKTPWGDAVNFANRDVREFFIANATYWAHEYGMDGLRLDATHALSDPSPIHILKELPRRVRATLPKERKFLFFAEDERNERWLVERPEQSGAGLDAVWADDFHHHVRSAVAGDNEGYYADYTGSAADIARTLNTGWFYSGQPALSSGKPRGTQAGDIDPARFVYCIQNHDQIGNRALGDRLQATSAMEAYRAASALLLLSPYTPLLFQGQEWAASTPFLYFTDHNEELGKQITEGRRSEFAHFGSFHREQVPDPQAEETFIASKLKWDEQTQAGHREVLALYKELLAVRKVVHAHTERDRGRMYGADLSNHTLAVRYVTCDGEHDTLVVVNLSRTIEVDLAKHESTRPPEGMRWQPVLSTNECRFGGNGDLEAIRKEVAHGSMSAQGPEAVVLFSTRA